MKATTISTPVGTMKAPLHPRWEDKLEKCTSNVELFELVEPVKGFIDPDAINEVDARGLLEECKEWHSKHKTFND